MHPLTPQGAQPQSPACTNPMTPVSHHGGPHTPGGGPVTPGDPYQSSTNPHNAPMTPLTNPLTPGGNPVTPGPATPVAPSNPLADLEAPLSNQNMPPCSPMTPQNAQSMPGGGAGSGAPGGYPNRPDAPLTPSTPNGPTAAQVPGMNIPNGPGHLGKAALIPPDLDLSAIIPNDQPMAGNPGQVAPNPHHQMNHQMHHGQNYYSGPRMAGHHPG